MLLLCHAASMPPMPPLTPRHDDIFAPDMMPAFISSCRYDITSAAYILSRHASRHWRLLPQHYIAFAACHYSAAAMESHVVGAKR